MSTRDEKRAAAVKTLVDAAVMARDVRALGAVSGSLRAYAPADMQAIVQGITTLLAHHGVKGTAYVMPEPEPRRREFTPNRADLIWAYVERMVQLGNDHERATAAAVRGIEKLRADGDSMLAGFIAGVSAGAPNREERRRAERQTKKQRRRDQQRRDKRGS